VPPPKDKTEFNPEGISESLKDTAARTLPYYKSRFCRSSKRERTCWSRPRQFTSAIVMDLDT